MLLRKSQAKDIKKIMQMISQAQRYMKENNIDQWQNGYPDDSVIENDIKNDWSYVLELNGEVVASAAISFEEEPSYNEIFEGSWLSNQPYAVLHRIVVDTDLKGKGLSSQILKNVEEQCLDRDIHSIKIDTHEDNKSMQRLVEKNDYTYCGKIYLEDGSPRIAFEKLI